MNGQRRFSPQVAALFAVLVLAGFMPALAQEATGIDLGTLIAGYRQSARLGPGQRADDKLALDAGYAAELTVQIISGSGLAIDGLDKQGPVHLTGGAGTRLRRTLIADKTDRRWQISLTGEPPGAAVEFVASITRGRPATQADRDRQAAEEALAQAEAQARSGGDRARTTALFDGALQSWKKSGDGCGLRNAEVSRARYSMQAQDYAGAAQFSQDAVAEHCDEEGSGREGAEQLLLSASLARGDLTTAVAAGERALSGYRVLGDQQGQLTVLRELAQAYRRSGNTSQAIDALRAARTLTADDPVTRAAIDVETGELHLQGQQAAQARDDFQQALDGLKTAPSAQLEGRAWLGLMGVAHQQGDKDAEANARGQAQAACTRSGDSVCLQILALAQADALLDQGQPAAADPLYQQVMASPASTPPMLARARAGRGYVALARQQWEDARTQLEAAAKAFRGLKDAAGEVPVQLALGDAIASHPAPKGHSGYDRRGFYHYRYIDKARPLPAYAEALRLARQAGAGDLSVLALADLALAERDEGRWSDARRDIDAAVSLIEGGVLPPDEVLRRSVRLKDVVSIYELQTAIAAHEGEAPVTDLAARSLIEAERQRSDDLAVSLPSVSDLKGLADGHWALLEYRLGETASDAWLVTPAGVQAFRLPGRSVIEPPARRLSKALAAAARVTAGEGRNPADIDSNAQQLGRDLLQPLTRAIANRNLAIVADGALAGIPFALLLQSDKSLAAAGDRHLVRLPSITALMRLRARATVSGDRIAVVGEPVLRADDPRLGSDRPAGATAAAPDSASAVLATVDAARVEKLLGFDASRTGLRQQDWHGIGTLHVATPTVLNLGHPDHSGIVLSLYEVGGQAQNGFLKVGDIAGLHLPLELVVLADTAVAAGDPAEGGDPYALSRAFLAAGARQIMSSLWRLEPEAASAFMRSFYDGLSNRHLAAPAALGAAQQALREDARWNVPSVWAAYEIEGDWH